MSLKDEMLTYRAKESLSCKKAADKCGVSSQTWVSIEKGYQNPSPITERKIRLLIGEKEAGDES